MASTWNDADIAIIGMAGRFPGADDVGELWRNLRDGLSAVRALTDEELLAAGVDPAALSHPGLVKAIAMPRGFDRFDATFFGISHREAELMDPQQRLLLEVAWQALEDAGYVGEAYPGPIGVFAGASTSTYLLYQVMANPAALAAFDPLHIELGNSGDYVATRLSHKLGLTGPSFHIQSACSTGLVALHTACQSLLAEGCDMALAGGASINVSQLRGYMYQEGGIVSPDGLCRTFDARAQGSIVGSGAGMVVLKRMADAVADGDAIRAVIRGSAINNDGSLKVGYTAPSVEGQAKVIAEALATSGVEAAEISYVEAHGTGTAIGDPIEVEALTRAFDTDETGFCALGSVKTNLGHLATAAGITGLIKTTLALQNGMIPPSLNFETPNPEIDFASSPFYVNVELKEWPRNGAPRRAGVSAFGFGGTNAHVVLEEAPELPSQPSRRPYQLLLLSAKSPAALDAATANLAARLRERPEIDLADVAFTLQRGRRAFGHRRALVCRDAGEAAALLADPAAEGIFDQPRGARLPGRRLPLPGPRRSAPPHGGWALRGGAGLPRRGGPGVRAAEAAAGAGPAGDPVPGGGSGDGPGRRTGPAAAPGAGSGAQCRGRRCLPAAGPDGSTPIRRCSWSSTPWPVCWMDWGMKPQAMIGYSLGSTRRPASPACSASKRRSGWWRSGRG